MFVGSRFSPVTKVGGVLLLLRLHLLMLGIATIADLVQGNLYVEDSLARRIMRVLRVWLVRILILLGLGRLLGWMSRIGWVSLLFDDH
jgi:hypothetical protein